MSHKRSKYDFSFFKPRSDYGRANVKLITSIIIVWFLAVFGFHILMKAIEKPVPEAQLVRFEEVWPNIVDRSATPQELRDAANAHLNLLARHVALRSDETFKLSFTSLANRALPKKQRAAFLKLTRKDLEARKEGAPKFAKHLGLEKDSMLAQVLPYGLVSYNGKRLSPEAMDAIPPMMQKYMTHYRSAITDAKFLGFPFPYFYTAVLLLIIFIGLCIMYCKIFDKMAIEHGVEDEKGDHDVKK